MYVCMYVCMYVYMYVCMYVYMYVCMCVCVYVCMYLQLLQACIPEVFTVIAILGLAIIVNGICFALCISKLKSLTVITMVGPASLLEAKSNLVLFLFQIESFVLAFSL